MANLVKTVELKVLADDAEAQAKLDAITAKADKLRELNPEITPKINDFEVKAKLAVLRQEVKDATRPVDLEIKPKLDKAALAKAEASGGHGGGGFLGTAASLFSLAPGSIGGTGGGVGSIAAVGAIAQGLTAGTVAAVGLGAALLPIAGKILPEITSKFGKWETQIDNTKSAKQAIGAAGTAFGDLLKAVTPLVTSMMPQLTRLFTDIGKSATSGGLKTFFTWMAANAPKAFDAVAKGFRIAGGAIHFLQPLISSVADVFKIFFHLLDGGFDLLGGVIDLFTGHWHAAGAEFKSVEGNIVGIFHDLWDGVTHILGDLTGVFKELPGKILSALGNLGSMLFGFGEHIISMLASGISSAAGGVLSGAMHFVASVISSFIPHSPAKQGPLSGSGSPDVAGRKIALMLGQGIRSGSSAVSASSSALAAAAGIGGTGGGGSAGRAVQLRVSVAGGADASLAAALMKLLRFEIVQTGGGGPNSVQRALGQTT